MDEHEEHGSAPPPAGAADGDVGEAILMREIVDARVHPKGTASRGSAATRGRR